MADMKKCPKCGGEHLTPILYGYPDFNEETKRRVENRELFLGGCRITGCDPKFHCFDCGKNVGKPPALLSNKYGEEDYRDIVTSVKFSNGGYGIGFDEVIIEKLPDRIAVRVHSSVPPCDAAGELSAKEWKKLRDRLFCSLYVHEWKESYVNPFILDGVQWALEFRLTNRRVRNIRGSNAFPAYWNELKRTFKPFFQEHGDK